MLDARSPPGSLHACPSVSVTLQRDQRGISFLLGYRPKSLLTNVVVNHEAANLCSFVKKAQEAQHARGLLLHDRLAPGTATYSTATSRRLQSVQGAASHVPARSLQLRRTGLSHLCPETRTWAWGGTAAFLPDLVFYACTPQVRIALQLDDGSRLQDTFCSGQTLWELLSHFAQTR